MSLENLWPRERRPSRNLFLRVGVHGLLHVLGYEHATEEDAGRMEGEEKRLLLGYLSPSEVNALFGASECDN